MDEGWVVVRILTLRADENVFTTHAGAAERAKELRNANPDHRYSTAVSFFTTDPVPTAEEIKAFAEAAAQ